MAIAGIAPGTCVVRDTASTPGRTRAVAPGATASRYLHYGRIILAADAPPMRVEPGAFETGLICVNGEATVETGGRQYRLAGPGDVLLFPSGLEHGATILDEPAVLIDIFSPPREDFLPPDRRGE